MVIFKDRLQAGESLAEKITPLKPQLKNPLVLGIPRGGIPVGRPVADALNCTLDTLVLRKLPIPTSPEAGFGAVTLDKVAIFNQELLSQLYLTPREIDKIVDNVHREVLRRNRIYRRDRPFPALKKRSVILTDDGLASGYTMLAAVKFARKKKAGEIIVAVPVAHREAFNSVKKESDKIVALHVSDLPYFAVASFYREFPDMSDKEVAAYFEKNEK